MYVTEHNRMFQYIVPLIETYHEQINFKTTPLQEIVKGPYFEHVRLKSETNAYCSMKCNRHKNKIRKEIILYDTFFRVERPE